MNNNVDTGAEGIIKVRKSGGHHCFFCGVKLMSVLLLKAHVREQHTDKPFKCQFCLRAFSDSDGISKHLRTVHSDATPYLCELCGRKFKLKSYLTQHNKFFHGIGRFKCCICNPEENLHKRKTCRSYCPTCKKQGKRRTHNGKLMCANCRITFDTLEALDEHLKFFHKVEGLEPKNHLNRGSNCLICNVELNLNGRKKYYCTKCKTEGKRLTKTGQPRCIKCKGSFSSLEELDYHVAMHLNPEAFAENVIRDSICTVCSEPARSINGKKTYCTKCLAEGKRRNRNGTLKCNKCEKTFPSLESLDEHLPTHKVPNNAIERDITCVVCNHTFESGEKLAEHWPVHAEGRPFLCSMCPRTYKVQNDLDRHVNLRHTKILYECSDCGMAYETNFALNQHKKNHVESRPFACTLCERRFKLASILKKHMITHDEVAPLECPFCPKRFKLTYTLNQHLISHSDEPNFACSLCDKTFKYGTTYRRHMSVHTGDMPHCCTLCNKRFRCVASMNKHMLVHFADRESIAKQNYTCPLCPDVPRNTFRTFARFNKHMLRHSGNKESTMISTKVAEET